MNRFRLKIYWLLPALVLGLTKEEHVAQSQHNDPSFFAMEGRAPVTYDAVQTSEDELQIVAFKVMEIRWLKKSLPGLTTIDTSLYDVGKARIEIVDAIYSEHQRISKGDMLWLQGYRQKDWFTWSMDPKSRQLPFLMPDHFLLVPGRGDVFLAMLKKSPNDDAWEVTRLQADMENARARGESLAGLRAKLRSAAKAAVENRPTKSQPFIVVAEVKPLGEGAAVRRAERFISRNGYTDARPSAEKDLAYESIEHSNDTKDLLKTRHDTLEPKAYGIVRQRKGGASGWTVVFRYKHQPASTTGRAVTMHSDGSHIRVEHMDFILSKVDKVLQK